MRSGFIAIDKPAGITSHDCVARIRKQLGGKGIKVGHSGTLDPMATGVLVVAVGKATRLLGCLQNKKIYQGTIRFGITTDTDDVTGQIVRQVPVSDLVPEQVLPWQSHFVGAILQRPPMVSALRQGGKRLYELAREGETVEVPEREVLVDRLEVLGWRTEPHWELDVEIHCAGGTYIRSIARDWGAKLGCGGTLAALRRTMNSGFYVKDAVLLDHVTKDTELLPLHVPLLVAGNCYPAVRVSAAGAKKWLQGQALATDEFVDVPSPCGKPRNDLYLVFDENNHLLGAGRYCGGIIPSMVLTNCGDG